jgi:hypothetical protein
MNMTRAAPTKTHAVSAAFTSTSAPLGRGLPGHGRGSYAARVTSGALFCISRVTVTAEYFGLETHLFRVC